MKTKLILIFIVLILNTIVTQNFSQVGYTNGVEEFIPLHGLTNSDYLTDWSNVGVEGGIPSSAHYIDFSSYNLGSLQLNINAAITDANSQYQATGNPVAIKFPAGTYTFTFPISLKSGVILIGISGEPNANTNAKTTFRFESPGAPGNLIIIQGEYPNINSPTTITIAPMMDDISINVDNSSAINVGDYIDIRDAREGRFTGTVINKLVGQVVKVTGKSGNTLFLEDKITINHPGSIGLTYIYKIIPKEYAGVMNLIIERGGNNYTEKGSAIFIKNAVNCFVSGVYSTYAAFAHVHIETSSHIEIRGNSFKWGFEYSGGHGYGVNISHRTTNTLIEDNVLYNLRHHIVLGESACRNVIGYNYTDEEEWEVDDDIEAWWNNWIPSTYNTHMGEISFHGNYAHRNLVEGNSTGNIMFDGWWEYKYPKTSTRLTQNGPYNVVLRNKLTHHGISVFAADYTFVFGNDLIGDFSSINTDGFYVPGYTDQSPSYNCMDIYGLYVESCNNQTFVRHIDFSLYQAYMQNYTILRDISHYKNSTTQIPAPTNAWPFGCNGGTFDEDECSLSSYPASNSINAIIRNNSTTDKVLEDDIILLGIPSATIYPTTNYVGSAKADASFSGYFTIFNTGDITLNLTIQAPIWGADLVGGNPANTVYKTLSPGSSTTINYNGWFGAHTYGPFTETITIDGNSNNIHKTHSIIGTLLLPDLCYGETQGKSASPEEQLFDGAFLGYFDFESDSIRFDKSKSIKERLSFAYDLLKQPKTERVENICKMIIELYPESEMGISFYAMGLLWEASLSKEAPEFGEKEFKSYLMELTERKEKYKIYGYSQLILSLLDVGNDIEGLEKLFFDYEYDGLKELALFHQFVHYYIYKQDKETARKVSDQLDEMFVDSRYGYQAHLIFGDDGYTIEGLKELIEKKQSSLLAKRGESKTDILSEMPTEYKLFNNYPNPFNPTTTIKYSVPKVSDVKLTVYNMMGQLIKTLVNETKAPGFYNVEWNGTNENNSSVASGIYFYRFESGNFVANNKMILIK